jgi:hypothetical protein
MRAIACGTRLRPAGCVVVAHTDGKPVLELARWGRHDGLPPLREEAGAAPDRGG